VTTLIAARKPQVKQLNVSTIHGEVSPWSLFNCVSTSSIGGAPEQYATAWTAATATVDDAVVRGRGERRGGRAGGLKPVRDGNRLNDLPPVFLVYVHHLLLLLLLPVFIIIQLYTPPAVNPVHATRRRRCPPPWRARAPTRGSSSRTTRPTATTCASRRRGRVVCSFA
jgi:hypothetical protein